MNNAMFLKAEVNSLKRKELKIEKICDGEVWLVIYERCNVSQSGSKFSKTEGIKILRKSVMVKFAGIHKIGIQ